MVQEDHLIGQQLGQSQITKLLGAGGMAVVYLAYQPKLNRQVALKILPPVYAMDPGTVARFYFEAQTTANLIHPNIIPIYDFGEERNLLYIVMKYIEGGTLRERMEKPMKISEAIRIFLDIAKALEYAHAAKLIHRDLKPFNVLLDKTLSPEQPSAILTDFGIAKIASPRGQGLTRGGAGVGTPEYMSPEQCRGDIAIDTRADIYAMGILLYELLCGKPPFTAQTEEPIIHAQIHDEPQPPSQRNRAITPAIEAVILRAMRKQPDDRFQTIREMAATLERATLINKHEVAGHPSIHRCPVCGSENATAMNFCHNCGVNLRGGPPAPLPAILNLDLPPVTCLRCGISNLGSNRFCTRCGTRLSTIVCSVCGRVAPASQHYCVACGNQLGPGR